MVRTFEGIRWIAPTELGVSQLYLNEAKLKSIEKWFDPNRMDKWEPLPVYDFGNSKLTLTDGHSRAFVAYQHQVKVPIVCDTDEIVTNHTGQLLYKNDIIWCLRFGIRTIADLGNRIISAESYQYACGLKGAIVHTIC